MKIDSPEIKKVFGNDVNYIEIQIDLPFGYLLTKETFLTIVYDHNVQKPDTEITLQDYLDRIDDAIKRGVI